MRSFAECLCAALWTLRLCGELVLKSKQFSVTQALSFVLPPHGLRQFSENFSKSPTTGTNFPFGTSIQCREAS